MEHIYDLIIIGGGPGGYTAALYAARSGLDVLVLEKMAPGGQMTQTSDIDNYPGFDQGIDGYTLGEKMRTGAERFGARSLQEQVLSAELTEKIKKIRTAKGTHLSRAVIIATGACHRHLGLDREEALSGRGVAYCAACDGMFYKDKTVAVIGGGNSAVQDALLLSRLCKKVILVHRRDTLRAEKIHQQQLQARPNVELRWNSIPIRFLGTGKISGLELQDVHTGQQTQLELEGVFISIGQRPATELFQDQLQLDAQGYIVADESTCTGLPGVFAVGDVRTKQVRQIVTATADGAVAAHFAQLYLAQE